MILLVGFKSSTPSVKEEKKASEDKRFSEVIEYLRNKYVPCTGREFDLTLSIEGLIVEVYAETEHMCTAMEMKAILTELEYNVKRVGDKRIAYARRCSVL